MKGKTEMKKTELKRKTALRKRSKGSKEIIENDRMFRAWALKVYPKCALCGWRATDVHHVIHRSRIDVRWVKRNILTLCRKCHMVVQGDKNLERSLLSLSQREFIDAYRHKTYILASTAMNRKSIVTAFNIALSIVNASTESSHSDT